MLMFFVTSDYSAHLLYFFLLVIFFNILFDWIFYVCVAGSKLQRLVGHVEFVNVSFHYPTRPTVYSLYKYCVWVLFMTAGFLIFLGNFLTRSCVLWFFCLSH